MAFVQTFLYRPVVQPVRYDFINGVKTGPIPDGSPGAIYRTEVWKDRNATPNWAWYVRTHHWKPQNTYIYEKVVEDLPKGYPFLKLIWIPTGDYSTYHGNDNPDGLSNAQYLEPTLAERSDFFNNLYSKVLLKVKDQKVNLAVFAAERHQTIKMLGDTAGRIARAYRSVRRGHFGDAFRELGTGSSRRVNRFRSAADNWLQLQYGWLPLLSDAYGAAQELERTWERYKERPSIQTSRAQYIWSKEAVFTNLPIFTVATCGAIYRARVWVSYTVDCESANFLGRVGLTNPLEVAWELVPFSFVVDWFLPVGRFLSTLDATLGCTFVNGGTSGLNLAEIKSVRHGSYSSGNFRYEYDRPDAHGTRTRYERGALGSFPAVTLPQLKDPVSQLHCANALALLAQVFSRK